MLCTRWLSVHRLEGLRRQKGPHDSDSVVPEANANVTRHVASRLFIIDRDNEDDLTSTQ